ncbi:MAG: c-type cytochrome [Betaproteobacteria bacterium]
MKSIVLWVGIAGLLLAGGANAQSGAELAKSKNCMNCHDIEKKKVGPSFKDIAAKYKDNKDAEATIVGKLKEGKGHPVKVAASEAELKALVAYALTGK